MSSTSPQETVTPQSPSRAWRRVRPFFKVLPLVAGRPLGQSHGELVADASLGLGVGEPLLLAREEFRVAGLTRQILGSGGDAVVFATLADAQLVMEDAPSDAIRTERERRTERLRATDLGRGTPSLESLLQDPRWRPPALSGFAIAVAIGGQAFPHFPRRVVLTPASVAAVGGLVMAVSTIASLLGVVYALRVDAGRALEG